MGLNFFISNKPDILINKLAGLTDLKKIPVLKPEIVVVQNSSLEHWLSMELASKKGVCANTAFYFPNALIYDLHKRVIPDLPDISPFEPFVMTWKVMKLLSECKNMPGFEALNTYVESAPDFNEFQIAYRLSHIFDQYLIFRPDMVLSWEQGGQLYPDNSDEHWQSQLWRMIVSDTSAAHRVKLMEQFFHLLQNSDSARKKLPCRITVFGLSSLPPFHMNFFNLLSTYIEVDLFLVNPCRHYWGNILSDQQASKVSKKYKNRKLSHEELHIEKGNSLLAVFGNQAAEFFDLIMEFESRQEDCFEEIEEKNLLTCIQADILNLYDRGGGSKEKTTTSSTDTSVQIHSCHSCMREIEVLRDNLLFMFEAIPDLQPHEIVVMAPDIDTYAPLIQSVFNTPESRAKKIPFSLSDSQAFTDLSLYNVFVSLISIYKSRFGVSEVMQILESTAVQKRFNFTEDDILTIELWVSETRICWGIDEAARQAAGFSLSGQNTWKAGLERLLLGYAMPGEDEHLFNNILPYDDIDGSASLTLGRFIKFTKNLFSLCDIFSTEKTLKQWSEILTGILNRFFLPDQMQEAEIKDIKKTVSDLFLLPELSGFTGTVSTETILQYLKNAFSKKTGKSGFMTGGVTFCRLVPMRTIPFRVVCLLGINDGTIPGHSREPGFNLVNQNPRPCDRIQKNDDQYMFFESFLCSREIFYISFVGQNIRDNTVLPPSPLISTLLDYIDQGFLMDDGSNIIDHLVTRHPLQAFSSKYFKVNKRLRSYSEENYSCAKILMHPEHSFPQFIDEPLPDPDDSWKTVGLKDLINFFVNPSKYLLQKRLGLYLEHEHHPYVDRENFSLSGLDRYWLEQDIVKDLERGVSKKHASRLSVARGILPHAGVGEYTFDVTYNKISDFLKTVSEYTDNKPATPVDFILHQEQFRINSSISMRSSDLFTCRYAALKAKDFLRHWLCHLALCTATETKQAKKSFSGKSILAGLDGKNRKTALWKFAKPENPSCLLNDLLSLYLEGLRFPLLFFPESSFCFARETANKSSGSVNALKKASRIMAGNDHAAGEQDGPYVRRCFGDDITLDEKFKKYSLKVFEPLLRNCEPL